jgi:putative intracellular protease/amidase
MKNIFLIMTAIIMTVSTGLMTTHAAGKSKRILMVVAPVQIMDSEYNEPRKLFDEKGANVKVASTTMQVVTGDSLKIKPDLLIADAKASDYDAIVLIGGMGIFEHILNNQDLQKLVKNMHSQGKYVCAICGSSVVLAKAGILKNIKATTFPDGGLINQLKDGGALYVPDETVVSGKIVTGNGPGASAAFAKVVCETIGL